MVSVQVGLAERVSGRALAQLLEAAEAAAREAGEPYRDWLSRVVEGREESPEATPWGRFDAALVGIRRLLADVSIRGAA